MLANFPEVVNEACGSVEGAVVAGGFGRIKALMPRSRVSVWCIGAIYIIPNPNRNVFIPMFKPKLGADIFSD